MPRKKTYEKSLGRCDHCEHTRKVFYMQIRHQLGWYCRECIDSWKDAVLQAMQERQMREDEDKISWN